MKFERGQAVTYTVISLLVIVLLFGLVPGIRIVDQSKTCAIVRLGKVIGVSQTGFQFTTPYITSFDCYSSAAVMFQTGNEENKKADYWDYPVEIKTSDGQTGNALFNILYSVDPQYTEYIRSNVAYNQDALNEKVVAFFARSTPRDVASEYTADGLYASARAEYAKEVQELLTEKYKPYGVTLLAFELRDINFSPDYEASIEQQQIQEENIQTAMFITEQKKQEAEQARIAAQGQADSTVIQAKANAENTVLSANAEAEALDVVAQALRRNPDILTYEAIKKLNPNVEVMMLPSNEGLIYQLPK